jgi:hypothetical protein
VLLEFEKDHPLIYSLSMKTILIYSKYENYAPPLELEADFL